MSETNADFTTRLDQPLPEQRDSYLPEFYS
jgi:hypothetical protein